MLRLDEATRQQLINKSKNADKVKSYGTTRWERRNKQHIFNSISQYNQIDMNALFKGDLLSFRIPVKGETKDYEVEVLFEGILKDFKDEIKMNKNNLQYKCIYKAIIKAVNRQDILIGCTCPDWKYRQAYYATKGQYNGASPEVRPSKITNPNDTKGAGCKHVMHVLGNLDWALKLATTVYNYIKYMEKNQSIKFEKIIFPTIFDIPFSSYQKIKSPVPGEDNGELANTMDKTSDKEVINKANQRGDYSDAKNQIKYNPDVEEPEEEK